MWKYNYLCHHGIKGQRWGVRRYQNEDGTLTPAGKTRKRRIEIADKRLNNREKYAERKYGVAKSAARLGTSSNIDRMGESARRLENIKNAAKHIRSDEHQMELLGKKTTAQFIASVGTSVLSTGAAIVAASMATEFAVLAIPASIAVGSAYVARLTRR